MKLSSVVHAALVVLFARQFWVAGSTFKIIPGEGPRLQRLVLPLSMLVLIALAPPVSPSAWSVGAGVGLAACSLALLEWSRRTIRGQYFSYLFSDDVPGFLWTAGPYASVRNPFYSSYLLAYAAAAFLEPGPVTLLLFAGMFVFYRAAAIREERKFAQSPLAAEYDAYRRRTGRFVPRLRATSAPPG